MKEILIFFSISFNLLYLWYLTWKISFFKTRYIVFLQHGCANSIENSKRISLKDIKLFTESQSPIE